MCACMRVFTYLRPVLSTLLSVHSHLISSTFHFNAFFSSLSLLPSPLLSPTLLSSHPRLFPSLPSYPLLTILSLLISPLFSFYLPSPRFPSSTFCSHPLHLHFFASSTLYSLSIPSLLLISSLLPSYSVSLSPFLPIRLSYASFLFS